MDETLIKERVKFQTLPNRIAFWKMFVAILSLIVVAIIIAIK